jgi:hypothetical protein
MPYYIEQKSFAMRGLLGVKASVKHLGRDKERETKCPRVRALAF